FTRSLTTNSPFGSFSGRCGDPLQTATLLFVYKTSRFCAARLRGMDVPEEYAEEMAQLERFNWVELPEPDFFVCPDCDTRHPCTRGAVTRDGLHYATYRMELRASEPAVYTTLTLAGE